MTPNGLICAIFLHDPPSPEVKDHNQKFLRQADNKIHTLDYVLLTDATTYKEPGSIRCGHDLGTSDVLLPKEVPSFTITTHPTEPPQLKDIGADDLTPTPKALLTASRRLGHFRIDGKTATPVVVDEDDRMTVFFPDDIHDKLFHGRTVDKRTSESRWFDGKWCSVGKPGSTIEVQWEDGELIVFPLKWD
ncbi:hypothetical protein NW767_015360 [Fusarium falciforme]|nr:hypothetical protein NW767_015360 [Fusarium falciforme]